MGLQSPLLLSSGSIARYPLSTKEMFATRMNKFADFSRQTFAQLANPLSSWVLNLSMLTDAEASDWKDLFEATQGAYAPFSFIDPWDNLLQYSETQENVIWQVSNVAVAADSSVADPFGITSGRQRVLTISNTSGIILQTVPI